MRTSHTASSTFQVTVRDIADQLATTLDRPVTIRETARGAGAFISSGTDPHPTGGSAILELPVHDEDAVIGYIVVDNDGRPALCAGDFESIDAAAALFQALLRDDECPSRSRESVFQALLVESEAARRSAYARALHQRWLHAEAGTVVRALLIDAAVGEIQRIAFARHLGNLRPVPAHYAGLQPGTVFLVGPPSDAGLDHLIIEEGAKRGIRILGIGSASPAPGAEDLRSAADEAAIAATLAAALPQFHPAVDASDLGGWLLLASASASPGHLHIISPAAHALYTRGDEGQRLTVETYLDVGSNVAAACELLFVHRTTLYYRLERMPEIVRDALADGVTRSTLHVALKLIRLWEATGRV